MKVGFLSFMYEGDTGSATYARCFVDGLARKKEIDEIRIITSYNEKKPIETMKNKNFKKIYCSLKPPFNRYEFLLKSFKLEEALRNVDIIQAQHSFEGLLANKCKKDYGTPFILVREVVSKYLPSIYSRILLFNIEKFLTKKLDYNMLVSWSNYMVENYFLKWSISPKKITVIPGGIDTKKFNSKIKYVDIRKNYRIDDDEITFLSVKVFSMSNILGLLEAIKAFNYFLRNSKNDAKYMIIGDGRGRIYLEKLINRLGINKNIILVGNVPNKQLINYYRSVDATIHFFAYDPSISISMLESLACGIPIITTNTGETRNIVNENVGFIVPPDTQKMGEAMDLFCRSSELKKRMSKNAIDLVKKRFDIDVITDAYVKLYKKIIGE